MSLRIRADKPAHPCSLTSALTVYRQNHWILQNVLIESKMPRDYFAHAQDDLNLQISRMFEGTCSRDMALASL